MFFIFPIYIIFIKLILCFSSERTFISKKNKIFNNINIFESNRFRFLDDNNKTKEPQTEADWLASRVSNLIKREVKDFLINRANMSQECIDLFYKCIIHKKKPSKKEQEEEDDLDVDNITYDATSNYYFRKMFGGASKHKNDFSSYDFCKYNNYKTIITDANRSEFPAYLTYFIMTIDESNRTKINENNETVYYYSKALESEDLLYIRAFCLPQEKRGANNFTCSTNDYFKFIRDINNDLNDLLKISASNETNTTYFFIGETEVTGGEKFLKVIPFILILFQIIIVILRYPVKYFFKLCYKKKEEEKAKSLVNDIIDEEFNLKNKEKKEKKENTDDTSTIKKFTDNKNKIVYPNWFKIYNKCYSLTENFRELFNFSLNSTDINNDSGLTYIRGLKSFSFFFLIFGLTLLSFMNSFSKTYSKFLMYDFLNSAFYLLFFIGLRYSPRIIFSCSGYTLSFKFISYIQKNDSIFGVVKFILYQIHKYLLILLFFLLTRYSLFIVMGEYGDDARPMWEYFKRNILNRPDGAKFLISFLDLTAIKGGGGDKRIDQTLIDYFWLTFNEVFFFFIGTILLYIGYKLGIKYGFRMDWVFLGLLLINIIGKTIFSYVVRTYEKEKYYATLYYYLFDYGKFMLRPLFNSPYYLIGMYFGFINYSAQKGITTLYKANSSQDRAMVDLSNMLSGELEINEEEKKENEKKEMENNEIEEVKEIRDELIKMPFLRSGVSILTWLRNHKDKIVIKIIGFIITILLLFFVLSHFIYFQITIEVDYKKYYNQLETIRTNFEDKLEDIPNNVEIDADYKKMEDLLLLGNYIKNTFINVMYRIDIELFVFLTQTLLFILYFTGNNFINDFFCHIFWGVINKPYYSIILIANPLMLYMFYQSETKITLNFFNVALYSIITGVLSYVIGIVCYLFFELPYKRLIRYLLSKEEKEEENVDNDGDDIDEYKEKED